MIIGRTKFLITSETRTWKAHITHELRMPMLSHIRSPEGKPPSMCISEPAIRYRTTTQISETDVIKQVAAYLPSTIIAGL